MKLTDHENRVLSCLVQRLRRELGAGEILVYGSAARGTMDDDSDIDLLVVFREVTWDIERRVNELCFYAGLDCDRLISTALFTQNELTDSPLRLSPMVLNARKDAVPL